MTTPEAELAVAVEKEEAILQQIGILAELTKTYNLLVQFHRKASHNKREAIAESLRFIDAMYRDISYTIINNPLASKFISKDVLQEIVDSLNRFTEKDESDLIDEKEE